MQLHWNTYLAESGACRRMEVIPAVLKSQSSPVQRRARLEQGGHDVENVLAASLSRRRTVVNV